MERGAGDRTASSLFAGFRALGLFSNDIPHVVRFSALKRRFYVTTCVGKSFHTYDAPAVDVVAVGLMSGQVIIHNIKFDESIMKFRQDWGPITSISFRTGLINKKRVKRKGLQNAMSVRLPPIIKFAADVELSEETIEPSDEMIEYDSPEQLNEQLVTLSLLPESRWKNLLNLDIIKKKNKPKEPPKVPKSAPFFIPTIPGLVPRYAAPEQNNDPQQSKVVNLGILAQKSDFCLKLEEGLADNKYEAAFNLLKELGPSGIETELRSLSPDCGGSIEVMKSFLKMIRMMLERKRDFELAQAYLALFLKDFILRLSTYF
ncbi:hypothetical protein CB1_000304014 [Camelus ferus]|nr:hypothetical protein CB1_000304014 [Camelus ferus]